MAVSYIADVIGPIQFPNLQEFATSGIYFLHLDGVVVYVGKAVHMRRRIGQHMADATKVFDGVSCIPCEPARLDALERHYINKLLPKHNQCSLSKRAKSECEMRGLRLPQPPIGKRGMNFEEAAQFLGITVQALRDLDAAGNGPRARRYPRSTKRRFVAEDLRRYAAQHLS